MSLNDVVSRSVACLPCTCRRAEFVRACVYIVAAKAADEAPQAPPAERGAKRKSSDAAAPAPSAGRHKTTPRRLWVY